MFDIHVLLHDERGELARLGKAMGDSGVSLEGGGVFTVGNEGHAHFLVEDGETARLVAQEAGLNVVDVRKVLVRRLKQDQPGQLGAIASALADAGVNITTQYSDHSNRLILVVDDVERGAAATAGWAA